MKRETLVGMCFFFIVLLAAQEAVAMFKQCAIPSRFFEGKCNGSYDDERCENICTKEEHSSRGSCNKYLTCICYQC
ncbi:unnamed protein product [Lathyrus oleraceus]